MLPDDPVKEHNVKGTLTYATRGPNTRTTQLFFQPDATIDRRSTRQGFAPIGKVMAGMDVVESFYSGYGEMPPRGRGPIRTNSAEGNDYLRAAFSASRFHQKSDCSVI